VRVAYVLRTLTQTQAETYYADLSSYYARDSGCLVMADCFVESCPIDLLRFRALMLRKCITVVFSTGVAPFPLWEARADVRASLGGGFAE
jgi:hypothetical protein